MSKSPTIFSQLLSNFPRYEFNLCVKKYQNGTVPRKLSFHDQFLAMTFAQLTFRESLRDIEVSLLALGSKRYHLGFRTRITRSTLAYANENRDWRIWNSFALHLIGKARKLYAGDSLDIEFKNAAYALDSTTITLCLELFPWARFRTTKSAIKLHTQLDLRGNIPSFIHLSHGRMSDVKLLDQIYLEPGAMYVMDRAYTDFQRLNCFTQAGAFFVTRLKSTILYRRLKIFSRNNNSPVRCDASIQPLTRELKKYYPQPLRVVEYYDEISKRKFSFVTNNFTLPAQAIADFYRSRWKVELFFKWIKQNLRIKAFFGTSENAVKTQIWIAISLYLQIAILKKELKLTQSLHTILQVLSVTAAEKIPLLQAFKDINEDKSDLNEDNQLNLFNIPIGH